MKRESSSEEINVTQGENSTQVLWRTAMYQKEFPKVFKKLKENHYFPTKILILEIVRNYGLPIREVSKPVCESQIVTDNSMYADLLYHLHWYKVRCPLEKFFVIMIHGTQRPTEFDGYCVIVINLVSFTNVRVRIFFSTNFFFFHQYVSNSISDNQNRRHLLFDVQNSAVWVSVVIAIYDLEWICLRLRILCLVTIYAMVCDVLDLNEY